jgi:hypothetical protein
MGDHDQLLQSAAGAIEIAFSTKGVDDDDDVVKGASAFAVIPREVM